MPRRVRPAVRRSSSPWRWLLWLAGLLVAGSLVLMLISPSLVTSFIRSYLHRDEFRQKMEEMISTATGGTARLDTLRWNDDTAAIGEARLENARGWDVDAAGIHASLDFGAIRLGKWSIANAGADEVTLRRLSLAPARNLVAPLPSPQEAAGIVPSFLRKHIPTKIEVNGINVQRFSLEQDGWKIGDTNLGTGPWSSGQNSVSVKLEGGSLQTPLQPAHLKAPLKLDLVQATLRAGTGQLQLSDVSLRWKTPAEATMRGNVKFDTGAWQLFVHAQGVPLEDFLDPWWQQRLSGNIQADCDLTGSRSAPMSWKANVALENGVLQGLPILEKLATYTRAERFKRIVLDICKAKLSPQGDALRVDDLIVQSNGLLHIEGGMTLRGRVIDGSFMVGVTPETLRWIPGADSRVFTESNPNGPPGLLWTHVRVTGPLDAPQEDLSARLIGSAGMSLLFDTPAKTVQEGADKLLKPVFDGDAAKMPGKVIEGVGGVLENSVKKGADVINKMLPVFPGK